MKRFTKLCKITCVVFMLFVGTVGVCFAEPSQAPLPYPQGARSIQPVPSKKIALVIDDFGNDMKGTEEMLELPVPFTVAVMPFLPTTRRDAEWAHSKGKPVFVHLPMEPMHGHRSWLGPGAITLDLTDEEIHRRVEAAVNNVPFATGINNHMGSKATGNERVMRIVLEVCKERGLVFLDSKTNYRSVGGKVARELGVKYVENEMFLDDVASVSHVTKQVKKLKERLLQDDACIVIGHVGRPGKETSQVLRASIPQLQKEAEFVPVSTLAQ